MSTDKQNSATPAGTSRRKPYVKPLCLSEKIFETTALACGKLPAAGGLCSGAPKSS